MTEQLTDSRKGENWCGNMHWFLIVTRNTNPKELKLPSIREQECYVQGAAATKQETEIFRSLGLSRSGTVDWFPAASQTPEPGIQPRSELWVPRQGSNCPATWDLHGITLYPPGLITASSHPHTLQGRMRKGRGGVGHKVQELDTHDGATQSPGEACSSSQALTVKTGYVEYF